MVVTTELLPEDPDCPQNFVDGRRPGKVGMVYERIMTNNGKVWLISHNYRGDATAYVSAELEPFLTKSNIRVETYFFKGFMANECSICGKKPTVVAISFWLSFRLGTHKLIHFCEDHTNDVDVLEGVGKALLITAKDMKIGTTWQDVLKKDKIQREKISGLIAIRADDYDQFGCPHCGYQLPGVEFTPNSIVYVLCGKCNLAYAVFADGVTKKSTMVEVPNENKVRATLQEHPKREFSKYGTSPYRRIFRCGNENCQKLYPSDRHETKCDDCDGKVNLILVPNKKPDAVSD